MRFFSLAWYILFTVYQSWCLFSSLFSHLSGHWYTHLTLFFSRTKFGSNRTKKSLKRYSYETFEYTYTQVHVKITPGASVLLRVHNWHSRFCTLRPSLPGRRTKAESSATNGAIPKFRQQWECERQKESSSCTSSTFGPPAVTRCEGLYPFPM